LGRESGLSITQVRSQKSEEEPVSPPAGRKKCPNCPLSFKLQIQLNRHKKHCAKRVVKSEPRTGKLPSPRMARRRRSLPGDLGASPRLKRVLAERKKTHRGSGGGSNRLVPPPGTGIACPDCGKEFFSQSRMQSHHVDLHQPGHFPCPGQGCGKVFSSKNKQTSHYSK
jgi:hypothetical protein